MRNPGSFNMRPPVSAARTILQPSFSRRAPATLSVIAGETKLYFASLSSVIPQVKAGSMKALAVTGPKRSNELPNVPTMQESGYPGFDVTAWHGIVVPRGTPKPIVDRLHA